MQQLRIIYVKKNIFYATTNFERPENVILFPCLPWMRSEQVSPFVLVGCWLSCKVGAEMDVMLTVFPQS